MILSEIRAGTAVFLDANIFVYHFAPDPLLGSACTDLLERISRQEIVAFSSSHVLSNVAHRLMALEAIDQYGWSSAGIAYRLKQNPAETQKLVRFRHSVEEVANFGVQVLPVLHQEVLQAAVLSQQHGLLSGDALVIALMQTHGLAHLASHDADFDRVPGITRYVPA